MSYTCINCNQSFEGLNGIEHAKLEGVRAPFLNLIWGDYKLEGCEHCKAPQFVLI